MKIELAPEEHPIGFEPGFTANATKFFLITFENRMEADAKYPVITGWCAENCKSHWNTFPLKDPRWGVILTQGLIGFSDPDEAILFRLAF